LFLYNFTFLYIIIQCQSANVAVGGIVACLQSRDASVQAEIQQLPSITAQCVSDIFSNITAGIIEARQAFHSADFMGNLADVLTLNEGQCKT
jgi:hypothetical protein